MLMLLKQLGLLSNGSIWGYAICVIVVAFFGKFFASGLAAKLSGFNYRESAAVGSLMACKGLVELIVLNIGLDAGILNEPIFAMFVLMGAVSQSCLRLVPALTMFMFSFDHHFRDQSIGIAFLPGLLSREPTAAQRVDKTGANAREKKQPACIAKRRAQRTCRSYPARTLHRCFQPTRASSIDYGRH